MLGGGFIIGGGPFFFHKTSPVTPFFCLCFVCLCRFYLSLLKKRDDAFGKKKIYKFLTQTTAAFSVCRPLSSSIER